jgi:hypothetical protein
MQKPITACGTCIRGPIDIFRSFSLRKRLSRRNARAESTWHGLLYRDPIAIEKIAEDGLKK